MSQLADPPRLHTPRVGEMQRADFPFRVSTDNSDAPQRKIAGYASVFNVPIPSYQEVVDPGAFTQTLQEDAANVKVLWQHDPGLPIGKPTLMKEDPIGLYVEAQLADTATVRDEYMPLLLEGVVDRFSIGFRIIDMTDAQDSPDGLYHLTQIKLMEFSPVTFPANESAIISDVRSNQVLSQAKRALGIADERKPMSSDDAKFAMAVLMGARGAGSFSDLPVQERRGLYERVASEYERHGLTPPPCSDRPAMYSDVKFEHDEQSVYAARSLRKRLSDVTSTAQHAARLGIPIDSGLVAEAEAALDAIQALGLGGVQGRMDRIAEATALAKRLGITIS